ncbi:MAG: restriction endonuclease [Armatimonadetes bacterium RBG_16_58_9]|nr:MAG: restriction endonuclease [Armatimonadetes bacterium RBG_16_58_9]
MPQSGAFRAHLSSAADLVTPYEEIRAGFVALALERNRRATPAVEEARALKAAALRAKRPIDLLRIPRIQRALLTSAGISDKAANHLVETDKREAIQSLIDNFLDPAGESFVEELVYRFLLTRGDTLGGSMRNLGGAVAQHKLTRSLLGALHVAGLKYKWLSSRSKSWIAMSPQDADIELDTRGLSWVANRSVRTLVYNLTPPLLKKNLDFCLLRCRPQDYRTAMKSAQRYLAIGELKGGIDPAGADEHWKTAATALDRARKAFAKQEVSPYTFFIGACIVQGMAEEIWAQLSDGTLANAANLGNPDQLAVLCRWLVQL